MSADLRMAMLAVAAIAGIGSAAGAQAAATDAPVMKLGATTLGFGNVVYGSTPAQQTIILSNTGGAALQIQGISSKGNSDFTTTNTCGTSVSPHGQCHITIAFAPHAIGARSATISIRSNAAGSPHEVKVGGTGCRYFSPAAARFFLTSC